MVKKYWPLLILIILGCGCAPASNEDLLVDAIASSTIAVLPLPTESPPSASPPSEVPSTSPPTEIPPLQFAVIGDFGMAGPDAAAVAELVLSWNPEFILTTGDNNYPAGEAETIDANIGQYYQSYIGDYQGEFGMGSIENRFFPVLGNHDWDAVNAQPYLDYFYLPGNERYYEFVWGDVHFFMLDSDWREPDGIGASSVQAEWLQTSLAASISQWQVVVLHTPPYSSGHHGDYPPVQWPFATWGADLVLAGHEHLYERLLVDEIYYVTNGLGGGASRYAFENESTAESLVRYRAGYGAILITVSPTAFRVQFIQVDGTVVDEFSLTHE